MSADSARTEAKLSLKDAYIYLDSKLSDEVRHLGKVLNLAIRTGADRSLVHAIEERRNALSTLSKLKVPELAAAKRRVNDLQVKVASEVSRPSQSRVPRTNGDREALKDRARGAMLGLAVGEAVGVSASGMQRGSFGTLTDLVGGGLSGFVPGEWAADTAMALALGECLTSDGRFYPLSFLKNLLAWRDRRDLRAGSFIALDRATNEALEYYAETGGALQSVSSSVGNGSLARVTPVALRFWNEPGPRCDVVRLQCGVSHDNPLVVATCIALADIVADAIAGEERATVLGARTVKTPLSDRGMAFGSWHRRRSEDFCGEDEATVSLEAAMWAVGNSGTFREAVLKAANFGGDASSTAAIAGLIAGALHGKSSIPSSWLDRIYWSDHIEPLADRLLA